MSVIVVFLRPLGLRLLKVADLSVFPVLHDGNNAGPVQMTGLNAARFIKNDPNPWVVSDEELSENFGVSIQ